MNRTTSTSIGGRNFILDETAYATLERYLCNFRKDLEKKDNRSAGEVMDEVENRIADILTEKLHGREVVDVQMVREVIAQLGLPGGGSFEADCGDGTGQEKRAYRQYDNCGGQRRRKLYRDQDRRVLGGVCSGLAWYLDTDVVLMRVLFVVAFIFGLAGFWIYLVIWIIAPAARTMVEKSEMTGNWPDGGC